MTVQWYRIKRTYEKPHGGFLAIGPRLSTILPVAPTNTAPASGSRR